MAAGLHTTIVVMFWTEQGWVEVAATVTEQADGTVVVEAELSHFTSFAVMDHPGIGISRRSLSRPV